VFKYLVLPILLVGTNIATAQDCQNCNGPPSSAQDCPIGSNYGKVVSHFPTCIRDFPDQSTKLNEKISVRVAEQCILSEKSKLLKDLKKPIKGDVCCKYWRGGVNPTLWVADKCWNFFEDEFIPFTPNPSTGDQP
jgi:hypothetical protein